MTYNISEGNEKAFQNANYLFKKGQIDDAIAELDLQIEIANQSLGLAKDSFFDYSNDFELFLFSPQDGCQNEKIPVQLFLWPLYNFLSYLLIQKKMLKDASIAAMEAIKLNPLTADPVFNLIDICFKSKKYDEALELLTLVKPITYSLNDVSKYYHLWGKYFRKIGNNMESICAYRKSLPYDYRPELTQKIIDTLLPNCLSEPTTECRNYNMVKNPADFPAIKLALQMGQESLEDGDEELALFFLRIANTVIQRDDIGDILRNLMLKLMDEENISDCEDLFAK